MASYIVEWRRGEDSNGENVNWFMDCDVVPNIENEAPKEEEEHVSMEEEEDFEDPPPLPPVLQVPIATEINTSPSVGDVLDGKPVHRSNDMFESSIKEEEHEESFDTFLPNLETFIEDVKKKPLHPDKRRTSVSMKQYYVKTFEKSPNKKGKAKNNKLDGYLDKQHALLHGQLDHSLLPAVWSYLHTTEQAGIPHHPSSKFFLLHQSNMSRAQSTVFSNSRLPRSVTMSSRAESEPGRGHNFKLLGNLLKKERRGLTRQRTDMSLRPLPPVPGQKGNPYEVPVKSKSAVSVEAVSRNYSGSEIYDEVRLSGSKLSKKKSGSTFLYTLYSRAQTDVLPIKATLQCIHVDMGGLQECILFII